MTIDWKEAVGIVATLFVFIGFTMKGENKIRVFNAIGSAIFVVYGLLIGALSVWILNGACLILNIYKLIKDSKSDKIIRTVRSNHKDTADIAKVIINQSKNKKI